MTRSRVLAIGLDGYEVSLESRMIADGELPHIAELRARSARYPLDHGAAQRTGLAWEHFATALSPDDAGRWAAVDFDGQEYLAWQEGTRSLPWAGFSKVRTVVFDTPYFDMEHAPGVRGLVSWGAHDPGIPTFARPADIAGEFARRFGPYPAHRWTYGLPWPSASTCAEMGGALAGAVELRAAAARWLLAERLTDWDLGIVVVSEPHSAIEGLWHGVDADHPLAGHESADAARDGLRAVYRAVDALVGSLRAAFPDATLALFSLGGMGPNQSDVASMALLPEFLFRRAFGKPLLESRDDWRVRSDGIPRLNADEDWNVAVNALLPAPGSRGEHPPRPGRVETGLMRAAHTLARRSPAAIRWRAQGALDRLERARSAERSRPAATPPGRQSLDWMPAYRYRAWWPDMPAIALPSFYDGRVRVNLANREARGIVAANDYERTLDELEADLRRCTNPVDGRAVVAAVERPGRSRDATRMGASEADLVIVWNATLALEHPVHGRIGPLPYRRTGGHTGPLGMAYLCGEGIVAGDFGVESSFAMPPTLLALAGVRDIGSCTGKAIDT